MPKEIDRDDVRRMTAGGVLLVEVLPPEDFEDEHLPGAVNIPLKALDEQAVEIVTIGPFVPSTSAAKRHSASSAWVRR